MNRTELLTMIQLDRGMMIAEVKFYNSLQDPDQETKTSGGTYFYKVRPELAQYLQINDIAVAQSRNGVGLVKVNGLHEEWPSNLSPSVQLRYLVARVDTRLVTRYEEEDKLALRELAKVEMKTKMNALTATLGFDPRSVKLPSLPSPEDDTVIDVDNYYIDPDLEDVLSECLASNDDGESK